MCHHHDHRRYAGLSGRYQSIFDCLKMFLFHFQKLPGFLTRFRIQWNRTYFSRRLTRKPVQHFYFYFNSNSASVQHKFLVILTNNRVRSPGTQNPNTFVIIWVFFDETKIGLFSKIISQKYIFPYNIFKIFSLNIKFLQTWPLMVSDFALLIHISTCLVV